MRVMTLKELLDNRNDIRVKEYERYGDELIFVGGFYWADNRIIPTDGGFYTLNIEVIAEWKGDNLLTIVRVAE